MHLPVRTIISAFALFALSANLCSAQNRNRNGGGGGNNNLLGDFSSQPETKKEPALVATPRSNPQIVYPFDLAMAGTEGSAEVTYDVDVDGAPHNIKIVKASKPDFGKSIVAAIETVRFSPPEKDGKPVAVTKQPLTFNFTKALVDTAIVAELKKANVEFAAATEVDGGMRPQRMNLPIFPEALLKAKVPQGSAQIEFVIDTDGTVHLPRIVSSSHDEFGWSAASTVLTWRFAPPMKAGKPVRVKVSLPFPFYGPGSVRPPQPGQATPAPAATP